MFGIETRLWARCTKVWILAGARDFSLPKSRPVLGPM